MTRLAKFKIIPWNREPELKLAAQDKKQHILTTAKNLFLNHGFKATTIQNIADAANVSKGAVYLQFPSKQNIIFEIAIQTEGVIWQQIQNIRADDSLEPRARLEKILETYIDYINENRLLNDLLVQEVGLTLTDEMLSETLALRQRWQKAIDSSVADLLGEEYEEWQADLGFCLNAVMEGFHAFLLVGSFEIPAKSLIQFLLLMVETMGPALKTEELPPFLNKNYLDQRQSQLQNTEAKQKSEIESLLKQMKKLANDQKTRNPDQTIQNKILIDTVEILTKECQSDESNGAIVQGMLASLRGLDEFSQLRQQLAVLLGVKLV